MELEDVYMQIRIEQKDLVSCIETVKMYCNMIATSSSGESAKRMVGNMPGEVQLLEEKLNGMEALCVELSDEKLLESFKAYRESVEVLAGIGTTVANCYSSGDKAGALEAQGGMYGSSQAMDAAYGVFEAKAADLERIAKAISAGTGEINEAVTESTKSVIFATESTAEMLKSMGNIAVQVDENRNVANSLEGEVSRFKKFEN